MRSLSVYYKLLMDLSNNSGRAEFIFRNIFTLYKMILQPDYKTDKKVKNIIIKVS